MKRLALFAVAASVLMVGGTAFARHRHCPCNGAAAVAAPAAVTTAAPIPDTKPAPAPATAAAPEATRSFSYDPATQPATQAPVYYRSSGVQNNQPVYLYQKVDPRRMQGHQ